MGTFQVFVKESTSLKLLNGTKDLLPWQWGEITAYNDGEKTADFELEVEDCWHRSRDTAMNARKRGWGGGSERRGENEGSGEGGLRANTPIDCAAKIPTTFCADEDPRISIIIFYEVREIQTPIRKF